MRHSVICATVPASIVEILRNFNVLPGKNASESDKKITEYSSQIRFEAGKWLFENQRGYTLAVKLLRSAAIAGNEMALKFLENTSLPIQEKIEENSSSEGHTPPVSDMKQN